jgi:hypothetical protein
MPNLGAVTTDRINVSKEVRAICALLDLDPRLVASLDIRPSTIEAVVFLTNEDGHKYVEGPNEIPAQETKRFEVRA